MTAPGRGTGGRREARKAQTRAAIRAAALELISRQGYHATTVAQIAEAAEVSHTTLFRYFDSKEQVLIHDDLAERHQQMLEQIPPGLDRFELARRVITDLFDAVREDPWASNPERLHLLRTEPVLRMASQLEMDATMQETRTFIAEYTGAAPDSLPLRVFLAALSGVMMHLSEQGERPEDLPLDDALAAVDLLEQGLPL